MFWGHEVLVLNCAQFNWCVLRKIIECLIEQYFCPNMCSKNPIDFLIFYENIILHPLHVEPIVSPSYYKTKPIRLTLYFMQIQYCAILNGKSYS